jgi:hypothetical protein
MERYVLLGIMFLTAFYTDNCIEYYFMSTAHSP